MLEPFAQAAWLGCKSGSPTEPGPAATNMLDILAAARKFSGSDRNPRLVFLAASLSSRDVSQASLRWRVTVHHGGKGLGLVSLGGPDPRVSFTVWSSHRKPVSYQLLLDPL